jgi:sporulation protein YlmC with PRC-barrel domain
MADANAFDWEGETVLDRDGEKVGKIEEIFLVEETGRPEWALVKMGRIKAHATMVPLTRARPSDKGIAVHVDKDTISEAPEVEPDAEPSEQQVTALYRHYGIEIPTGSDSNGHASGETGGNGASAPQATTAVSSGNGGSPNETGSGSSHGAGDLRDAPIADVAKQVAGQAQTLAAQEVKLAKAEMGEKVKEVGIGAGMAGGAGYVAYLASIAFMLCLIFALGEVMPTAVAALIVTVLLAAVAGVLAMKAKKKIQEAGPPIPEQTIESVKQTIETVKEGATWGLGQTR